MHGACFHATNVFSFVALFANNPFWCLDQKHVSQSRLGKRNQSQKLVTAFPNKVQNGEQVIISGFKLVNTCEPTLSEYLAFINPTGT